MGSGRLKPGWARVALGDVVRLCTDRSPDPAADGFERYVGLEHLNPGDLTIRRWGDVGDGTTFTSVSTGTGALREATRVSAQGGRAEFLRRLQRRHLCARIDERPLSAARTTSVHLPDGCVLRTCDSHVDGFAVAPHELAEPRDVRVCPAAADGTAPPRLSLPISLGVPRSGIEGSVSGHERAESSDLLSLSGSRDQRTTSRHPDRPVAHIMGRRPGRIPDFPEQCSV